MPPLKFIVQYSPKRANFLGTMTQAEGERIGAHFQYLVKLSEAGKLDFAGRRTDAAFGIAVFEADSAEEAKSIVANDPAVTGGVFSATCGEFDYALPSKVGL